MGIRNPVFPNGRTGKADSLAEANVTLAAAAPVCMKSRREKCLVIDWPPSFHSFQYLRRSWSSASALRSPTPARTRKSHRPALHNGTSGRQTNYEHVGRHGLRRLIIVCQLVAGVRLRHRSRDQSNLHDSCGRPSPVYPQLDCPKVSLKIRHVQQYCRVLPRIGKLSLHPFDAGRLILRPKRFQQPEQRSPVAWIDLQILPKHCFGFSDLSQPK